MNPELSQISPVARCYDVNASAEAVIEAAPEDSTFDLETVFRAQFGRVCRIIARVVRDPARAEELAVEAFLKLWRNPGAHNAKAEAWLYCTAVRLGVDELRRQGLRTRYEGLLVLVRGAPTPVVAKFVGVDACASQPKTGERASHGPRLYSDRRRREIR